MNESLLPRHISFTPSLSLSAQTLSSSHPSIRLSNYVHFHLHFSFISLPHLSLGCLSPHHHLCIFHNRSHWQPIIHHITDCWCLNLEASHAFSLVYSHHWLPWRLEIICPAGLSWSDIIGNTPLHLPSENSQIKYASGPLDKCAAGISELTQLLLVGPHAELSSACCYLPPSVLFVPSE